MQQWDYHVYMSPPRVHLALVIEMTHSAAGESGVTVHGAFTRFCDSNISPSGMAVRRVLLLFHGKGRTKGLVRVL